MSADADHDSSDEWLAELMIRPLAAWEIPPREERHILVRTENCILVPAKTPSIATPAATAKKSGAPVPPANLLRQLSRPSTDDPVQWRLQAANITNAGKILAHCTEGIEWVLGLHPNLVVFKIGATVDPMHRWCQPEWGYRQDKDFEHLRVLAKTRTAEGMCFLESALIALFMDRPGCRNIALGGDGISADSAHIGPFFVYVVYRQLPKPPHR